jgi:LemA protein
MLLPGSTLAWMGGGILLFWSVGAYNRLVQLRSDANAAFAVLDAQLVKQAELVHASLPASLIPTGLTQPGELLDEVTALWSGLRGAATQLTASLAAMRPRPLNPEAAAALAQAHDVLLTAWRRVSHEAHDLAGSSVPEALAGEWLQLSAQARGAADGFNEAVNRYNAAIVQFPAVLLAWLFGFKRARGV